MQIKRPANATQHRLDLSPNASLVLAVRAAECRLSLAAYVRIACECLANSGRVAHEDVVLMAGEMRGDLAAARAAKREAEKAAKPRRPRGRPRKNPVPILEPTHANGQPSAGGGVRVDPGDDHPGVRVGSAGDTPEGDAGAAGEADGGG